MKMIYNKKTWKQRILVGVATEGWIRYEWAAHRYSQIIPLNWQCSDLTVSFSREPFISATVIGFGIDDAYNVIIRHAIKSDVEWLLFIEDDVLIPHNLLIKCSQYMEDGKVPIVSGLYYSKGDPSYPLIFRGRGTGTFIDWKKGDKVWCDGVPFGCLLTHMSVFRYLWENSPEYKLPNGQMTKKIIETPRKMSFDPETLAYNVKVGTQDLYWCDRLIEEDIFAKTGWDSIANQKYPFLCDTDIFCEHIDRQTGRRYPTCLRRSRQ